MESRSAKSARHGSGTGLGADAAFMGPKSLTKAWSLYMHSETLAAEEAANLAGPEVVVRAGRLARVEETVSMVLAVR